MRETKFRGRHIITGTWMYGYLLGEDTIGEVMRILGDDAVERPQIVQHCQIDKKTVGQYTGLKDKNGNEIYEGDVMSVEGTNYIVVWRRCGFSMDGIRKGSEVTSYESIFWKGQGGEIIGNIYENPNLTK